MLDKHCACFGKCTVDETPDLAVDLHGDLRRVIGNKLASAEKPAGRRTAKRSLTQGVTHAQLANHAPGQSSRLEQVVFGGRRRLAEDKSLSRAPSEDARYLVKQLVPADDRLFLLGDHPREPQARSPAHDRDLCHRTAPRLGKGDDGMTRLVICDGALLTGREQTDSPLAASQYALDRLLDLMLGDGRVTAASGQKGSLVHDTRQVGAREPRRLAGDPIEVHSRVELLPPGMDSQDGPSSVPIWSVHDDLAVESSTPQ